MSLSRKDGGLLPDTVVQDEETILADSERAMRESARLARRHGVRLHTHFAETSDENEFCAAKYGVCPVELMYRCEFIGPNVFYAHEIYFNDDELATLRQRGAHVAHCPSTNMRL
jgi:cytosine/adenosine deaminase-related metal-dependent hydrolase